MPARDQRVLLGAALATSRAEAPQAFRRPVAFLPAVAAELNERPRQTVDWHTPAEKMAELLR